MRIHLLLDNSQEDLSSALESCEVCGSAHTPPGNWKRRGGEGGRREGEGQVKEGDIEVKKKKKARERKRLVEAGKDLETQRNRRRGTGNKEKQKGPPDVHQLSLFQSHSFLILAYISFIFAH